MWIVLIAAACLVYTPALASAQAAPSGGATQTTPRPTRPRAAAPARTQTVTVLVTDIGGRPLEGVTVKATGPIDREGATGADGQVRLLTVRPGTYRLRFESPEVVTFERELVVRAPSTPLVEVALSAAPPPPPPPPPPPAPEPPKPARPPGEPKALSVLDAYGKLGSARTAELGAVGEANATLIDVREPMAEHTHDVDELVYVLAGDGTVRMEGRDHAVTDTWLVLIPRGTPHTISRRGRKPFVIVSVMAGEP